MTVAMWSGDNGVVYVDRFVDPTNGNDSNDGLTLATAWKTLGKAQTSGQSRDRIRLPGGATIAGKFTFPADNMCLSTWGVGRAVIDGTDTQDCVDGGGRSNLFLENIEATQGLDFGFVFDNVHDITLVNCSGHDCGNDQLIFSNCQNCTVWGGSFYNAYTRVNDDRHTSGIEVKDFCQNILIDGAECYGNAGVASPAHWSSGIAIHTHAGYELGRNITIRNCYIHDGGVNTFGLRVDNSNPATMTDRAIVIEGNTILRNAYGGLQVNASAGASYPTNGVTIRNNVIRHNSVRYQLNLVNSTNIRVYRNILANNEPTQLGQNASIDNCTEVEFANNTLHQFYNDFFFSLLINGGVNANVRVRNNVFSGSIASAMLVYVAAATGTTGLVIDRNIYQYASTGNRWSWLGTNMNYTTWQSNNANDANSPARQDPLLTNPATNDYTLQGGSPAINQGTTIAGITDGYLGAAPDLGYKERA